MIKENLLPSYFKKIAIITAIVAIIAFFLKVLVAEIIAVDETRIGIIFKTLLIVSLFVLVFSKEKNESKDIKRLRSQELKGALLFGGFLLLVDSIQDIIFGEGSYETKSGDGLMIAILLFYLISFAIKKNALKN